MNGFRRYRNMAIASLLASICLFTLFITFNEQERTRFKNFNRQTIPDKEMEQIKSPSAWTLSFGKYYHLDSIQLRDEKGKQNLNISTIFPFYVNEKIDYSKFGADNYEYICPYSFPLNNKSLEAIWAMEILANCNFDKYKKMCEPRKVTMFNYLDSGLPYIFYNTAYKNLLRELFGHTLYVRPKSPTSIIKEISLNKVGRIRSIRLYNNELIWLESPIGSKQDSTTYQYWFQTSIGDTQRDKLVKAYTQRLSLRSLRNHREEAESLANKHINEIVNTLKDEKIEYIGYATPNNYMWSEDDIWKPTSYPDWLDWLLTAAVLSLFIPIILAFVAQSKKKQYMRLQNRLKYIREQFPKAAQWHRLPLSLNDTIGNDLERLLNKANNEWHKEEQEIENRQRQKRIIAQKVSDLKQMYPNGWKITKGHHPNWSDAEMVSHEAELAEEEKDFQQAQEQARFAERERIRKEREKAQKDIRTLSQAIIDGNIELAEKKVKVLNTLIESPTIDRELVDAVKKAETKFQEQYKKGIQDQFEKSYVDYDLPSEFMQGENWAYAVAKFPSKGKIVFPYRRHKIARRGYMESSFQAYLSEKLFGCRLQIIGDCGILPAENYRPYEPDIAIIDEERPSIRIDIEIDEPYSAIYNKPIHYVGCGDDFRDMNLNNLGWIVVRFSEQQVLSNMEGCVAFVAQVIHAVNPQKRLPETLLSCQRVKTQKRWTEIEAKVMASEKAREKYLDHEFKVGDSEQIEEADIRQTEKEKAYAKLVQPIVFTDSKKSKKGTDDTDAFGERDSHIQFSPREHVYLYNGKEELTPVSSVISCFFKPFDSDYWSNYKARQLHVSQGQILEEWDAKGTRSRDVGTFMHLQIENHYKGIAYQEDYPFRYDGKYIHIDEVVSLSREHTQFAEFLKDHDFKPFRNEWSIYDENLKIAGTIDMAHKNGRVYDIYDWKRSHRIVDFLGNPIAINSYGEKGICGLSNIDDTPYWHYCIQQNLYKYILETNYGIKVGRMYLVVFSDDMINYRKLEVPNMDDTINSIVEKCKDGTVRKRLYAMFAMA